MVTSGRTYELWGWAKNTAILGDYAGLLDLLRAITREISMTELAAAVVDVPRAIERMGREPWEDEGGATAIIVLSTSHAAIHGWPWKPERPSEGYFELAVSSCRDFDPEVVYAMAQADLAMTNTRARGGPKEIP